MENNLKWIVYCTICSINKKIYIGVHKTNPDIYDYYLGCGCYANNSATYNRAKTVFQRAVQKYGVKSFTRTTIAIFDNEDDAYSLEADLVNKQFLQRTDVYNTALGGKSGGQIILRIPCYLYSSEGNFIREYDSQLSASRSLNRNLRTIQRAIKDKTKCAGYFITDIKCNTLDISKMHNYEGSYKIPVFQYNEYGKYECCYESIKDAARLLNYDDTCIGRAIKLGIQYKGKYFTSVFDLEFSNAKSKEINHAKIHQYDISGKYIASYKNMQEAKNILGIKANIYQAIKLKQICGGFQWSFEKLEKIAPIKPKTGRARKIGKFDKDWNLLKEYKSLAECKKENGSGMQHVLSGRDEFAKGYRYKCLS